MHHNIWKEIYVFFTTGNASLTDQEVLSDVVYEPPTNQSRSLTSAIINTAYNAKLTVKLTIIQEEESIFSSTTNV